jgi:hypothetical protein
MLVYLLISRPFSQSFSYFCQTKVHLRFSTKFLYSRIQNLKVITYLKQVLHEQFDGLKYLAESTPNSLQPFQVLIAQKT